MRHELTISLIVTTRCNTSVIKMKFAYNVWTHHLSGKTDHEKKKINTMSPQQSFFIPCHPYLAFTTCMGLSNPTSPVCSLSHHPPGFKDQLLSMFEGFLPHSEQESTLKLLLLLQQCNNPVTPRRVHSSCRGLTSTRGSAPAVQQTFKLVLL